MAIEHIRRDSAEYAETIAEVFVETVTKSANEAMYSENMRKSITPALAECMQYVYLHGPSPIRQIACGLEVSLSAASQLVDRLVKKGLVTRVENAEDRRSARVEITEAGREAIREMRERRSEWFASILGAMPEEQRLALLDGIEGFLQVALADEENVERACVRCGKENVTFCVINRLKNNRGVKQ